MGSKRKKKGNAKKQTSIRQEPAHQENEDRGGPGGGDDNDGEIAAVAETEQQDELPSSSQTTVTSPAEVVENTPASATSTSTSPSSLTNAGKQQQQQQQQQHLPSPQSEIQPSLSTDSAVSKKKKRKKKKKKKATSPQQQQQQQQGEEQNQVEDKEQEETKMAVEQESKQPAATINLPTTNASLGEYTPGRISALEWLAAEDPEMLKLLRSNSSDGGSNSRVGDPLGTSADWASVNSSLASKTEDDDDDGNDNKEDIEQNQKMVSSPSFDKDDNDQPVPEVPVSSPSSIKHPEKKITTVPSAEKQQKENTVLSSPTENDEEHAQLERATDNPNNSLTLNDDKQVAQSDTEEKDSSSALEWLAKEDPTVRLDVFTDESPSSNYSPPMGVDSGSSAITSGENITQSNAEEATAAEASMVPDKVNRTLFEEDSTDPPTSHMMADSDDDDDQDFYDADDGHGVKEIMTVTETTSPISQKVSAPPDTSDSKTEDEVAMIDENENNMKHEESSSPNQYTSIPATASTTPRTSNSQPSTPIKSATTENDYDLYDADDIGASSTPHKLTTVEAKTGPPTSTKDVVTISPSITSAKENNPKENMAAETSIVADTSKIPRKSNTPPPASAPANLENYVLYDADDDGAASTPQKGQMSGALTSTSTAAIPVAAAPSKSKTKDAKKKTRSSQVVDKEEMKTPSTIPMQTASLSHSGSPPTNLVATDTNFDYFDADDAGASSTPQKVKRMDPPEGKEEEVEERTATKKAPVPAAGDIPQNIVFSKPEPPIISSPVGNMKNNEITNRGLFAVGDIEDQQQQPRDKSTKPEGAGVEGDNSSFRRSLIAVGVIAAIILIIAIVVIIVILTGSQDEEDSGDIIPTRPPALTRPPGIVNAAPSPAPTEDPRDVLTDILFGGDGGTNFTFEDGTNPAANEALDWLSSQDPYTNWLIGNSTSVGSTASSSSGRRILNHENDEENALARILLERYGLATFYFGMSGGQRLWELGGSDGRNSSDWLSPTSVCVWAHVACKHMNRNEDDDIESNNGFGDTADDILSIDNDDGVVTSLHIPPNTFLNGTIPSQLAHLQGLSALVLADTTLIGSIPKELGLLLKLTSLKLDSNALHGPLPIELSQLRVLRFFILNQNQLVGPIPSELSRLRDLRLLDLSQNALVGTIPSQLWSLPDLNQISLHSNQLTGSIAIGMGKMKKLSRIFLWGNSLTSTLPGDLQQVSTLEAISVARTDITGNVNDMFCDPATSYASFDVQKFPYLMTVQMDCAGSDPEVICTCCASNCIG